MFISVIIPVYQDWERLLTCLNALDKQENIDSIFEVIIVNNDPNDDYRPSEKFSFPIQFLTEPSPGSYSARNRGLTLAKGYGVLFTDSDCIPGPDWIFQAKNLLEKGEADLYGGLIEVFSHLENKFVKFEKAFAFPNSFYVEHCNFSVTANLLVKKAVVDTIGGFNSSLLTGGDSEFCNRAVKAGFKINFSPLMSLKHPARTTWEEMKVKAIRFGGRLPKGKNRLIIILKLLGKFRIRLTDIQQVYKLTGFGITDKLEFYFIKQRLRWVEAHESVRVYLGKKPGRK
ncbi:glycosyltransferase family 2 protein [Algoriphagus lutimaris]|uniref:glycosyltransferase family 2 protein n=1 Tax=Algoriphagus lutimaris TaxID=613197 RepID=UPI00196B58E3|nr:glycosyltransferase [Algoriphagus lutimaris]MBN3518682.1 glycosyltransferase family 2 protein [Algoriphagus lutimaris]